MGELRFVVAGYGLTALALAGYAGRLFFRLRAARRRNEALTAGRTIDPDAA